jgi:N-acetylneuraminic acid mutarotase
MPTPTRPRSPAGTSRRALGLTNRRVYRRRQLVAALTALLVLALFAWLVDAVAGTGSPRSNTASSIAAIEAGLEPWQLPAAVSREAVVPTNGGFTTLGGLDGSGASVTTISSFSASGHVSTSASHLADAVHDASAVRLGTKIFVYGGGSSSTVATVQAVGTASATDVRSSTVVSSLPTARSDSATVTVATAHGATAYIVGGYNGTKYLAEVLATTNGDSFRTAATLQLPVRYPAVAAAEGELYVFGGEVPGAGSAATATAVIQAVNPATGHSKVVARLPQPLYGASAFLLDGVVYVAGGETTSGTTLSAIEAFVPSTHKVLFAGWLPQAVAFGGSTTLGTGTHAVGYLVGGEVAAQTGTAAAGVASGTLRTVLALRPSPYGAPAGRPDAGSPFQGRLLIADRGNDRLLVLTASRHIAWEYPSATKPAPPGGFYFPDDAFFFDKGKGIIVNQEDNDTIVELAYPSGKVLWDYGHAHHPGSGPGYVNQPDDAYYLRGGNVTVAAAGNNEVIRISPSGAVVSRIGNGVDAHAPGTSIAYPNGDTPLADGNVLVSEIHGSWVDEYTPAGHVVWSVHIPAVSYPSDPQQLGRDLYLMTDYNPSGEGRIVEFTRQGTITWRYDALAGDAALKQPSLAERLPNGLIMVNDDYRDRMVVIDPATDWIVWQYGLTDDPGTEPGLLSIPDGFDLLESGGRTPTHPSTG